MTTRRYEAAIREERDAVRFTHVNATHTPGGASCVRKVVGHVRA